MAIPGIPSGENHSCASQQCGRNRIPRISNSRYRRRMAPSNSVPGMESFKSQKRRLSNWSSDSVSQAYRSLRRRREPAAWIRVCNILCEKGVLFVESYLQTDHPGRGGFMQRTVTVETITTVDGIAALRPCYERLQRATGNTLPFALH